MRSKFGTVGKSLMWALLTQHVHVLAVTSYQNAVLHGSFCEAVQQGALSMGGFFIFFKAARLGTIPHYQSGNRKLDLRRHLLQMTHLVYRYFSKVA